MKSQGDNWVQDAARKENRTLLEKYLEDSSVVTPIKFGNLLVSEKILNGAQMERLLAQFAQDPAGGISAPLKSEGWLPSEVEYCSLAEKLSLPYVRIQDLELDTHAIALLPIEVATRYHIIPLFFHGASLVVAFDQPTDKEALDVVQFITGHPIELVVTSEVQLLWGIDHYYNNAEEEVALGSLLKEYEDTIQREDLKLLERIGKEKPMISLIEHILLDAIHRRASDIHFRAEEKDVKLLFRIDGSLLTIRTFSKKLMPALVSRIKIIGAMDIAEHRVPQDGRAQLADGGRKVDLRISIIPTINGENIVIRILDTKVGLKSLDEIGFEQDDYQRLQHMLHKSYGMVLVTGPTGSGKSTTLYAALDEIRTQNLNIITVENPVEYHMQNVSQIQVNYATGYTFAKALRHILRHDPDVIMIGEIRDTETSKIAVESALTGHLVLSTLHTNDSAGTITRLLEMGVEPYLVASTLLGVLAQRLVRKSCPHCKEVEEVDPSVRSLLGVANDEVFYKGKGCQQCSNTGFLGRMAVYELLEVTEPIRELVLKSANFVELHQQAIKDGMQPLTQQALRAARQGLIPLSEVYRVRLQ